MKFIDRYTYKERSTEVWKEVMHMHISEENKKRLFYITGVLVALLTLLIIFVVNRAMPFMMDDEWYSTKLFNEEPVRNIADIIRAQSWHFNNWGGRSIAHGILQLTLTAGPLAADIINVVFNILLAYMIYKIISIKGVDAKNICAKKIFIVRNIRLENIGRVAWYFSMFWGLLYGLNANWKQSMCWQSGAANYLYMTTFILFYLWCYVRALEGNDKALPGISFWIWPLGLIAGWSNENMGPTVWLMSLGIMVYLWVKGHEWHWWMLWGNLTSFVGSLLVILAPGNFVRAEQTYSDKGLLWKTFLRCYSESKALAEFLTPTLVVLAFTLCLYVGVCGKKITKAQIICMLSALFSWGAMILSPHYPDRATFGTMVFLVCAIFSMVKIILEERWKLTGWILAIGGVVWLRGMFFLLEYTFQIWGWIV